MTDKHLELIYLFPGFFMRSQIQFGMAAWDELLDEWARCVDSPDEAEYFLDWVREFAKHSLALQFAINLKKYISPVLALDSYSDPAVIERAMNDLLEMARKRQKDPSYLKSKNQGAADTSQCQTPASESL